jgi:hypothetical protein
MATCVAETLLEEDVPMRTRIILVLAFAALCGFDVLLADGAFAADCAQGSAEEQVACLNRALSDLEGKVAALTKQMESKADNADALKWNDHIALINEDMRIYPRCLDNPGPSSNNITDVFANSCAKVPGQAWMIIKPYHMGR